MQKVKKPQARLLRLVLAEDALLLKNYASGEARLLLAEVAKITAKAPFRNMHTPYGHKMSVAMSNCGKYGWISDSKGYSYAKFDPATGRPWPQMPKLFIEFAQTAANTAGFIRFKPDACLINCYTAGTKLSLHQDRD